MEIKRIKVNNNEYVFINNFVSNRSGFRHETRLFKNDYEIGKYSCQYYNRTWESYTYQSVMLGCVNSIIEERKRDFVDSYKRENNITRLLKSKREIVEKEFLELEDIKELQTVYKELQ